MCGGVFIPSIMCADGCARVLNVGKDLSTNNVVELLGMFVAAWIVAKQSDVTHRFTLDNICFWCQQLTCPPYTGLGGPVVPRE